ncbi:MAG: DUF924 domain-containing protein, partial [Alphaproteobacteria bacterium]|nr:DUF924 domain-containing protein [Alphaproteobacteria bacterium]
MLTENDRQAIGALLEFWFAEDTKARWYDSTKAFDELCRQRFGALVDKAAGGDLTAWEQSADGALAACLLLDQMPRNLFRGTAKAFATDPKTVEVAARAIERGFDQELELEKRKFLYMPFMHSERLADQERSVAISEGLNDENTLHYAEDHADIIRRFGRFPHRNAILGRKSTP